MSTTRLTVILASLLAAAADWPQFRGPAGNGLVPAGFPAEWGPDKNVAWKVRLPGAGWSSPVVAGGKVFVTAAADDKGTKPKNFEAGARDPSSMPFGPKAKGPDKPVTFTVACHDATTGKELWRRVAAEKVPPYPIHPSNTYATESPAADAERVYALFAAVGWLGCYDHAGNPLWSKDVGTYPTGVGFGTGSSLALADGRLFLQSDNEKQSFLLALDPKTGNELWRADRKGKTAWATPLVWRHAGRTELVTCGQGRVTSYDPATGKELWTVGEVSASFAASAASDGERVYFGNSGPFSTGPLYAVRAGAAGDLTLKGDEKSNAGVAWFRTRSGPGLASPVALDGHLYVSGEGTLTCYDARTGERVYRERLPKAKTPAASLWAADGKVYVLDEAGKTFVVKAGPTFEVLAVNELNDVFWSTPAVTDAAVYLRGVDFLYCVRR